MYKSLWISFLWLLLMSDIMAQSNLKLSGKVTDEQNVPIPGAILLLTPDGLTTTTRSDGFYSFEGLTTKKYQIEIRYLGYLPKTDSVLITNSIIKNFQLKPSTQTLDEVVVIDHYAEDRKRDISLNADIVDQKYIKQNLGASLMNSLDKLPGVDAMNIGSGQSKPMIRGLSFNRVAVVENGITHQGQQWGADHGLEIDQYTLDRIEIVRGPASLMYGSDALGGIIDLRQMVIPQANTITGEIDLTTKSNNGLMGGSAKINRSYQKWHFGLRSTWLDWGDYRVPADFVDIYSYRVPLKNNRLRNTAGQEMNIHGEAGINLKRFNSRIYLSRIQNKAGFFANAHGLEPRNVDTALFDRSWRDIMNPQQKVIHSKVINKTRWQLENGFVEINLGYQNNHRIEASDYVSHGFMPSVFPENLSFNPNIEREFKKTILSFSSRVGFKIFNSIDAIAGLSAEYQSNEIGGRGFILPEFTQQTGGSFIYLKKNINDFHGFQGGLRYDMSNIKIKEYYDWFASPQIINNDTVSSFLQRSMALNRSFKFITWSVGYTYNRKLISLKMNIGKSFRTPLAQELAANGVNYHYFRFEKGNAKIDAEIAYQLDAGIEWKSKKLAIGLTPFFTWFDNYIYLNPTSNHDRLYGNGNQIFEYSQTKVMRIGGELHAHIHLNKNIKGGMVVDYVYSEQMSGAKIGYTLPYSPPASSSLNIKFTSKKIWIFNQPVFSPDIKLVAPQNLIVPPEEKTPGYFLLNATFGSTVHWAKTDIEINFQIQNILNQRYLDHLSYYRLINLPEMGRNFVINIKIPFKTFVNQ